MGIEEAAALSAAFLWSISSFVWSRVKLSAIQLNTAKNMIGLMLLTVHVIVLILLSSGAEDSENTFQLRASLEAWGWLALSGAIGIVLGDTLFFRSLQILGPRRALVMATFSPIFAAAVSWVVLGEILVAFQIVGILTSVIGIVIVVSERGARQEAMDLFPGSQTAGVLLGIGAAFCQAAGAAVSKLGMNQDDCSALEASLIRMAFAAIGSMLIITAQRKAGELFKSLSDWKLSRKVLLASILGTWLGIWLSQVAIKETEVGIAQTLLATSPLFAIPLVRIIEGHKPSWLAIAGTLLAVFGIALTVWN